MNISFYSLSILMFKLPNINSNKFNVIVKKIQNIEMLQYHLYIIITKNKISEEKLF